MKKTILNISLLAALCVSGCFVSCGGSDKNDDDQEIIEQSKGDWGTIAASITKDATTEKEKAEAIYEWICDNIAYDTSLKIRTAEDCYAKRKGVCQGYCNLYLELAKSCGVTARLVGGFSRGGQSTRPDAHAWIAAVYDGGNHLLDPTWGAGTVDGGKFVKRQNHSMWFDVDPYALIFTHYPDLYSTWSLVDVTLSVDQFTGLPYINDTMMSLNFDFRSFLHGIVKGSITEYPEFHSYPDARAEFVSVPVNGVLRTGQSYDFKLKPGTGQTWILVKNGKTKINPNLTLDEEGVASATVELDSSFEDLTLGVQVGKSFAPVITYKVR